MVLKTDHEKQTEMEYFVKMLIWVWVDLGEQRNKVLKYYILMFGHRREYLIALLKVLQHHNYQHVSQQARRCWS